MIKKKSRQLTKEVNLSFMHFADWLRLVRSFSRFSFNFLINWQSFNLLQNALLFNFELLTPFYELVSQSNAMIKAFEFRAEIHTHRLWICDLQLDMAESDQIHAAAVALCKIIS